MVDLFLEKGSKAKSSMVSFIKEYNCKDYLNGEYLNYEIVRFGKLFQTMAFFLDWESTKYFIIIL